MKYTTITILHDESVENPILSRDKNICLVHGAAPSSRHIALAHDGCELDFQYADKTDCDEMLVEYLIDVMGQTNCAPFVEHILPNALEIEPADFIADIFESNVDFKALKDRLVELYEGIYQNHISCHLIPSDTGWSFPVIFECDFRHTPKENCNYFVNSMVAELTDWLNGECYGFRVENVFGDVESCYGFIGRELVEEAAQADAEYLEKLAVKKFEQLEQFNATVDLKNGVIILPLSSAKHIR